MKKHLIAKQHQVEYTNTKGDLKHKWVNSTELFKQGSNSLEVAISDENYSGKAITCKLSLENYEKLMTKFEQHISDIWCNGRKSKHNLLKRITNDDKIQFVNLDSRLENNIICIIGNKLHFIVN